MRTIHLVSHTHWDREWYRTFQQFRLRLVHLVDGLLEILSGDAEYKHFMLDGQTIVLEDYLHVRPEAEVALKQFVQDGRLVIGPWHVLPDMFLVGPEAHVRNLLVGEREAQRFGSKMMIGYMPDSFGHIGQMPQILHGFGIDTACLWRGVDDQSTEFWWQSPDGSRVLMLYLRDSYSNGAVLNAGSPGQFAEQVVQVANSLAPFSPVSDLLIMYGTDHMEPPRGTVKALQFANTQLKDYCIVHSTLADYRAAAQLQIEREKTALTTIVGELRSSKRSHILAGVLSARGWIKQRNQACENLLEKWAEPFSAFASLAAADSPSSVQLTHPSAVLREAWQLLMECHPHDSICGCSIDQVHEEMKPRFDQVQQIGDEVTRQSLDALAGSINTTLPSSAGKCPSAIIVFNPSSTPRTDVVISDLFLPAGISDFEILDEAGAVVPYQSASGETAELLNVRIHRADLGALLGIVNEGRVGNLAIQDLHAHPDGETLHIDAIFAEYVEPDLKVWEKGLGMMREFLNDPGIKQFHIHARSPESAKVTFTAIDVPGLGWKTFHIHAFTGNPIEVKVTPMIRLLAPLAKLPFAREIATRLGRSISKPPYIIENDSLSVEFQPGDATLTLVDKSTGTTIRGLNRFVDGGDCGDTYDFCPPPHDSIQERPRLEAVNILRGPAQERMTVSLLLPVPTRLVDTRKARSTETVDIPITTTITLTHGVPRVDIHTNIDNQAQDHRLRVHFAAPFNVRSAYHDGHFEIVERPIGIPAFDSTWIEQPRPEVPQHAFTTITDGQERLTIANRGLPEVEVLQRSHERGQGQDGASYSEIALTLLRCVGWLSRDDFATRKGPAGPFIETPKAQQAGPWDFDYSIIIERDASTSFHQAWNYQSTLRAVAVDIHAGSLPLSGSFVYVDNPSFVVTAVKETDQHHGWIVRGYNIGSDDIHVRLKPWRTFRNAEQVNLAEATVSQLSVGPGGEVTVLARGHEIVTVMFSD